MNRCWNTSGSCNGGHFGTMSPRVLESWVTSRPRKSCDRFPSSPSSRETPSSSNLYAFPDAFVHALLILYLARPNEMCIGGRYPRSEPLKDVSPGSLYVRERSSLINFNPPLSFEIFRLLRCICDALSSLPCRQAVGVSFGKILFER